MRAVLIAAGTAVDARPLHGDERGLWLAEADDGRRVVVPRAALRLVATPRWVGLEDVLDRPRAETGAVARILAEYRPRGRESDV